MDELNSDTDPEDNLFEKVRINCGYYTDSQFNKTFKLENSITIIHFNSGSLYSNFHKMKDYSAQFNTPFSIIAITETWLNIEKGVDFE